MRQSERERVGRFTFGASFSCRETVVLASFWLKLLRRAVILIAALLTLGCVVEADTTSSISANFNGTPIVGGDTVWFTSVLKASGLGGTPVTIFVRKSTITFSANGTNYTVPAPDANITFSPSATAATITFSQTKNQWQLTVPSTGLAGNVLLNAAEYLVPQGGLPGGIKNVTWQANFSTDTAGISMQWQWAAAVFSSFSTNYSAIGVKPVDDNKASQYQNSDHAGTPESYEAYVVGGATGGGGSNYTGSYSGTVSLALPVAQAPTANTGGPYSGYVAQGISFNGAGSSDPNGYSLNYSWNFGDGTTGTGATPTHTYSSAGSFTVSLTVDDGRNVKGTSSSSATITLPPPPTVVATLSPAPNASAWNNSNVTVTFTCADTNVGVKSCPSPVTVATEGANQVVQGTATDNAGVTATTSVKVSIDKTPSTITASALPIANSAGWNNTNVTVTFHCLDSLSGVAQCPQPILISSSGQNQIVSGIATDVAGNTSTPASVTLNVELTLPSIVGSASPLPNAQGWNNANVTVSFACTQSSSPITSCPAPQTISTEGAGQSVSGTVTDVAGNSNTGQVNLSIAKTPPAIAAAISPQPNGSGWNNSPATVSFTCTKTTAPLATCPQPQTVSAEGANQAIAGTVTDVAGNSASTTAHVFIATTPPTITASVSPQANANNWNNSAVTVTFNCVATTAPIADCPQPQTISTEGAGQAIAGTATDVAGNSATAKVMLNIALTPPKIIATASPAPDPSGWNNSSVTVTFDCTNTTAPIATCPPPQTISTEGAGQTVSGTATDVAGNMASASLTLNIGTKPPTIVPNPAPPPNAAGWNNSNVTVSFACAPGTAPIATCPPPITLAMEGANQNVTGTATDAAGNSVTTSLVLNIDKTPPIISYSVSPAPNSNGINTTTPVTITFTCSDALSGVAACPSPISVTTPGMNQVFTGTASDVAGNTASATATVNVQTAPPPSAPSISAVVSPAPNAKGWNNSDVTVSFTCVPGSNPLASCSSPILVTTEGANQSFCGRAVDSTGLSTQACATVSLDKTPPAITVSQSPAASGSGWNNTPVTVTFSCTDSLSEIATCPPPQNVSTDGTHQVINGTAADVAGNSSTAQITLNIQQAPPTILQFTAPAQIAPGQSGTATVTASDSLSGVTAVVFQLNGTTLATLTAPPYAVNFTAPTTANAGDTLTLTVSVSDAAGNASSSSRGIQVVLAGVLTGQVLSDATGLPFAGASVQIIGGSTPDTSDNTGRYSLPSNSSHLFLSISTAPNASAGIPATVTVEREMFLQSGVGTVPVDARLTSVSAPTSIGTSGGSLTAGALTIAVAPGAVASATNFHLTLLSPQGLPAPLPLGWSPITAFDLRADTSTSASFNSTVTQLPSSLTLHLVRYDYSTHAWLMVAPNLGAVNGTLTIPIPSVGDFALVTPDAGNSVIVIPSSGQALAGVNMVALPAGSAATGSLNPPSVSPTGGTSVATLAVQSSVPLPSGTVIQANVQETYSLISGKQLSDAKRTEDILLYQYSAPSGAAAVASFPVTPSQTFPLEQLSSGNVHLDILSGRESVRGQVGGSDAVTVTGGDATLLIAAGSSPQDTAIAVAPEPVDGFLPATTTLIPLAEYNLDFSGQTLNVPAQLSVAAGSAQPGDNVFLAQIQRLNGVPYLVIVSLAQVNGTTLVTRGAPGLSGLTQGGDYIFYKLTSPTGYVSGTVTAASGPVPAMVQTDGLPFVTFTGSSGSYLIPALAGTVNLSASVPKTAVAGSGTVQVTAGQTATANLVVTGQTESASITPPNGSVGVPLTPEIDIAVPDAFDQTSVLSTNVTLTQNAQGTNTLVPVRFVFSQGGSRLAVFPQSALQPSTTYTFAASGVANLLGGLIVVPTITFTTQANTPPNFNTNALVFGMPDQNGNTQISAPANSFPPGTTILIVDQTNGVVLSLTVANDGSVTGQMPATIDDVLAVTIAAPDKTTATFTRSQFVAPDGTTAIGAGGGTVTGPGNTAIIIPAGALPKGTTFKLDLLDQTAFPQLPSWQGANFGSGIKITAPAMPSFNKEAKLAFPVPANAPAGAFYYVYRRLVDPNDSNNVLFETIDHAFVQGSGSSAQVVTASPPFCGYMNSFGNFQAVAAASYQPLQTAITFTFMMWDYDPNQAGVASQGLIAGKVFQNDASGNPGPLSNGTVATIIVTNNPKYVTTTTPACGTYSLFDPQFGGGPRSVTATAVLPTYNPATNQTVTQKQTITDTADEVNGVQPEDSIFSVTAGLEAQYRNIGRINFTFAPATPPPPPPQINISVLALDLSNNSLAPISGIVQAGTALTIKFSSTLSVEGAAINGAPYSAVIPDTPPANPAPGYIYSTLKDTYPAGTPGLYTIVATAVNPLNPTTPVTVSRSFLVVAAGGGNIYATPGQAPTVINTVPSANAQSVSVAVFPEITFNEPVTNVPGNLSLVGSPMGDSPSLLLIGIRSDGSIANPVTAADAITSLTIQPLTGLEFVETYTLTLNSGIVNVGKDQNGNPIAQLPLNPSPYTLQFTTFGPQQLGSTPSQYEVITRPVVIGQMAYAGEFVGSVTSGLGMFDISDPSNPVDKGVRASFIGRGIDIAGVEQSPVTGGALVAISAGPEQAVTLPGNVWLYSVPSTPQQLLTQPPMRVGGVSVTSSATQAGIPTRLAIKDNYLYTFTFLQGLQVVDLNQVVQEYQNSTPLQFGQAITTEGQGFATDAVINTIPLPNSSGGIFTMFDLKADDFTTSSSGSAGATQTLLAATGQLPLVLANPTLSGPQAVSYPPSTGGTIPGNPVQGLLMTGADGQTNYLLCYGRAVALGTIPFTDNGGNSTNKHIAVVVGSGLVGNMTTCPVLSSSTSPYVSLLVVVDLTGAYSQGTVACDPKATTGSPNCPKAIGFLQLSTGGTDVKLNGSVALVATGANVLLVNLENPFQPTLAGQITGTFGNWLGLTDDGFLVGSAPGIINGIQVATLGSAIVISSISPPVTYVDNDGKTTQPVTVTYQVLGGGEDLTNGQLQMVDGIGTAITVPVPDVTQGTHSVTVPAGVQLSVPIEGVLVSVPKPSGSSGGSSTGSSGGSSTSPSSGTSGDSYSSISAAVYGSTAGNSGAIPSITQTAVPSPQLISVSPEWVFQGSADLPVILTGSNLDSTQQVYIRKNGGPWQSLDMTPVNSTTASATIPSSLLASSSFLELNTTAGDALSIAFLVALKSLPIPDQQTVPLDVTINATSLDDVGLSDQSLVVSGGGLTTGMQVVLGQGGVPGIILPTKLMSDGTLSASLGTSYIGASADLEVFILSSDGTQISDGFDLTSGQSLSAASDSSNSSSDTDSLAVPNPAEAVPNGDVSLTSLSTEFMRYFYEQPDASTISVQLQGVNLTNGMPVTFQAIRGNDPDTITVPLTGVTVIPDPSGATDSKSPNVNTQGTLNVPKSLVQGAKQTTTKITAKGKASGTQKTATKKNDKEKAIAGVPFGGRLEVQLYEDKDGKVYIYCPAIDSQVPEGTTRVDGTHAAFSVVQGLTGDGQNGDYTSMEIETSGNTKQYFLRGLHLTMDPVQSGQEPQRRAIGPSYFKRFAPNPAPRNPVRLMASMGTAAGDCNAKGVVCRDFDVTYQKLGPQYGNYDKEISLAADETGVPASFLKSQLLHETSLGKTNFRYELATEDFKKITGDQPKAAFEPYISPYTTAGNQDEVSNAPLYVSALADAQANRNQFVLPVSAGSIRLFTTMPPAYNGDPRHESCAPNNCGLKAFIETVLADANGNLKSVMKRQPLTLVRGEPTWRRTTYLPAAALEANAGSDLLQNEILVNYSTGNLVLPNAQRLSVTALNTDPQTGELLSQVYTRLRVSYSTVESGVGPSDSDGGAIGMAPALTTVKPQRSFVAKGVSVFPIYTPRQDQCSYIGTNLQNEKQFGQSSAVFLAVTRSDSNIEFLADPTSHVPQAARDRRFCYATSQPYAASSYGISQVTPSSWNTYFDHYNTYLDISNPATPIFNLLTDYRTGTLLAAAYHLKTANDNPPVGSNSLDYERKWSAIIIQYNNGGSGYRYGTDGLIGVVRQGASCFEPGARANASCGIPQK